ncbi:hypothetical protein PVAP13_3NG152100 [Panicum virgatum]|uniref:Uncharacterized protein n=1 Tax=Panicum virgatum TaxID=38727 RepID=A0A8T0U8E3_PANVG|nr:hypothetical protein PVAP13_3NG152100 [Panicum virgatum]
MGVLFLACGGARPVASWWRHADPLPLRWRMAVPLLAVLEDPDPCSIGEPHEPASHSMPPALMAHSIRCGKDIWSFRPGVT